MISGNPVSAERWHNDYQPLASAVNIGAPALTL